MTDSDPQNYDDEPDQESTKSLNHLAPQPVVEEPLTPVKYEDPRYAVCNT